MRNSASICTSFPSRFRFLSKLFFFIWIDLPTLSSHAKTFSWRGLWVPPRQFSLKLLFLCTFSSSLFTCIEQRSGAESFIFHRGVGIIHESNRWPEQHFEMFFQPRLLKKYAQADMVQQLCPACARHYNLKLSAKTASSKTEHTFEKFSFNKPTPDPLGIPLTNYWGKDSSSITQPHSLVWN